MRGKTNASMRPRRFRRGIHDQVHVRAHVRACFNEAPAISPGNLSKYSSEGKLTGLASMRPRRFRRGIRGKPTTALPASACFNEAPAISPGNHTKEA